jgi:hypothetical protein
MSTIEERLAAARQEMLKLARDMSRHVDQRVEESKALRRSRERELSEKATNRGPDGQ